jgi:hypothetical protein
MLGKCISGTLAKTIFSPVLPGARNLPPLKYFSGRNPATYPLSSEIKEYSACS